MRPRVKKMTQDEWRTKVDGRLGEIENRLRQVEQSNAVDEVHRQSVERRLSGIEDTLKWLVRLIIGSVTMAALAFALQGGFNV